MHTDKTADKAIRNLSTIAKVQRSATEPGKQGSSLSKQIGRLGLNWQEPLAELIALALTFGFSVESYGDVGKALALLTEQEDSARVRKLVSRIMGRLLRSLRKSAPTLCDTLHQSVTAGTMLAKQGKAQGERKGIGLAILADIMGLAYTRDLATLWHVDRGTMATYTAKTKTAVATRLTQLSAGEGNGGKSLTAVQADILWLRSKHSEVWEWERFDRMKRDHFAGLATPQVTAAQLSLDSWYLATMAMIAEQREEVRKQINAVSQQIRKQEKELGWADDALLLSLSSLREEGKQLAHTERRVQRKWETGREGLGNIGTYQDIRKIESVRDGILANADSVALVDLPSLPSDKLTADGLTYQDVLYWYSLAEE